MIAVKELIELLFLGAMAEHYERERAIAFARLDEERKLTAHARGLLLTAPGHANVLERERALRYVAPLLGEHDLRGALDGYEQAARPCCAVCGTRLDPERELAPNPDAN